MTETILALIPSPPQGVWHLGPVPIRAYALCIIAGIIVALWIGQKRYAARGGEREIVLDAAIVAVPTGIIGGRLYHVMTDYDKYFCSTCDPVDALKITNGGLGIWGAVVLGTVSVYAYLRFKKIPFAPFADALAPAVVLARSMPTDPVMRGRKYVRVNSTRSPWRMRSGNWASLLSDDPEMEENPTWAATSGRSARGGCGTPFWKSGDPA